MRRLAAIFVLLALVVGVCPSMAASADRHGCCESSGPGCPALARTSCCAPAPVEAPSGATPATSIKVASTAPSPAVLPACPLPFAADRPVVDSHGVTPVPPLLRSCLRRI